MSDCKEIWTVLYDTMDDALCLASKASELCSEKGLCSRVWMIKAELTQEDRTRLARGGADFITHLHLKDFGCDGEQAAQKYIAQRAKDEKPAGILFISSVFSGAVAPGVASLLETGISADCTNLYWDADGNLIQSRPTFGGRLQADIMCRTSPAMATVRRGVFALTDREVGDVPCETVELEESDPFFEMISHVSGDSPLDLSRAEILVSGGAGMGSKANFQRLYELAERIGGQVSASRGAVAAGYTTYDHQVGQTGITVRPQIYLAFGISGAVQHLSGMMSSKTIIAVNPDKDAPIHGVSDYSIYADAMEMLDALLERLPSAEK